MIDVLAQEELEVSRTAAEMLEWVNTAHARFTASRELKEAFREGKLLAKELMEESFPIALFANKYFSASEDVAISQIIGNQKHDAIVNDRRAEPSKVEFIEVTVSDSTYEDSLRMEILNRDGNVAATGPVQVEGSRRNRKVLEATSVAVKVENTRSEHLSRILAAIEKKCKNTYPDGTALVVRVDDALAFKNDEDCAVLDDLAKSTLVPMISDREFVALALVGIRGFYLAYEL